MPVGDGARWLDEAVASVRAQTLEDWELVVVDDCATAAHSAAVGRAASADERIRVVATEAGRRGIVAALNVGLAAVRSPLVARMDADDVAHPDRFAEQHSALAREPGLFGVASDVEPFPESELGDGMRRYLAWQSSLVSPADIARDRFVESPFVHPSVMMRTEPLRDELGGYGEHGWVEDWDLFLRAMEAGLTFRRIARPLLRWRLHPGQLTRTDPRCSEQSFLACRAHYLARRLGSLPSECDDGSGLPTRAIWVLGAGPVGKALARALDGEGVAVAGFADIDPKKIGGRIPCGRSRTERGGAAWPVMSWDDLARRDPRPFAISAVGSPGARERVRRLLTDFGWTEGRDFLVAA